MTLKNSVKKQQDDLTIDAIQKSEYLTKEQFDYWYPRLDGRKIPVKDTNSNLYNQLRFIKMLVAKGGPEVTYEEYRANSLSAIARLGVKNVTRTSPYEKIVLEITAKAGIKPDKGLYLHENGQFYYFDKDGIVKACDAISNELGLFLYHKQWQDTGGGQESDSNEIETIIRRTVNSSFDCIMVVTGDYFTDKKIEEIQSWINDIAPGRVYLFTDQQGDPKLNELRKFVAQLKQPAKAA